MEVLTPDLCVIGGGSGGLSVAAGAVQMGASVVLCEGHKMGGDCLNYGCVPSKALLAAGKAAHAMTAGAPFGVAPVAPVVDFAAAKDHVAAVIAGIAPHDSVERFEGLGVTVIEDMARFTDAKTVEAGGKTIRARRFVIATGSRPFVPPIEGLEAAGYLTNETLFEERERPGRLLIIGAGPIGLEMAQAHRRLGAEVTVLEAMRALPQSDPELAAVALDALRGEGIEIREGAKVARAERRDEARVLILDDGEELTGDAILVATGRAPNVEKLNLEAAGIAYSRKGIEVDKGLRTSNRKAYAIGDVAGGLQFTHVAGYHAGLVIRSALFRMPVTAKSGHIPSVTYIDPEIAQVGLSEEAARAEHGDKVEIARFPFAENDRARAELKTQGLAKIVIVKGRIVGAGIVGAGAGEQIALWALAISKAMKIGDMAGFVAPYPTLSEVSKRAAGAYFGPRLFENDRVKWVVRQLARLG